MAGGIHMKVTNGDAQQNPLRTSQVVVAATREMGIGEDGKLPWKLPSDLKFFKELTMITSDPTKKNAVVMGRKTWESIPDQHKPLSGRLNVVLTRYGSFGIATAENVVICRSMNSALELLAATPYCLSIEKVFVIGGGQVLREALNAPECDAMHLTDMDTSIECDIFMPQIDYSVFQPWSSSFPLVDNKTRYSFVTYVGVQSSIPSPHALDNGVIIDGNTSTDKLKIERFLFLPKMIYDRHEEFTYLSCVEDIIAN